MAALALMIGMVGCSDDDNPAKSPAPPAQTSSDTTVWDGAGQFFRTEIDATSETEFAKFSFADGENDTVDATSKVAAPVWDIEFRREEIRTNGGVSSEGGGAIAVTSLGAVDFAAVTVADTTGKTWSSDQIEYFFDNWYDYNVNTHQLVANRRIYSMVDAGGHNYVKFRIDSLTGAGMPPDMGTVWLTYYYQPTADSKSLPGPTVSTSFPVESGTVHFDFSSGSVVTPANPDNATNWDLGFSAYNVFMNSGPKGTGLAEGFYAFAGRTDSTDINAFTSQPSAPMFTDIFGSAMTDWYDYQDDTHQLPSRGYVYLMKDGDLVYKLKIENYYKNVGGTAQSGNYTFIWNKL
jgi:hypothetical protein